MTDIRFYHLQNQSLEQALPKLMEKVVGGGFKAVIKAETQSQIDVLDKVLWDYDPASFLPHDKSGCDFPDVQTLYLTTNDENPNEANVLVLVDAVKTADLESYERCLYMFDGRNEDIVAAAREDWKSLKEGAHTMSYWQQREMGGWEQKV
ncbi:DNA polymerase III subunit chi [Kordiimonas aquimaris]|uniref:DNA polymerase III subunit chi n=1 Tax=Kordiimonas aquimaris TaxID=707591 RepID=UPI0021CEF9F7|nr:DNA polymerase III subunit chi [Kordiimonas aquimaris]